MVATQSKPALLTEKDFNPSLKRLDATVPGYWTLEEISVEIGYSLRKIQYDITGRPDRKHLPILKAYRVGLNLLVPDLDALEYIKARRKLS